MVIKNNLTEKTTIGDRFSASFIIFIASFLTMLAIWFLVFLFSAKGGGIFTFPFIYVFYFTGALTFLAFVSPNKSIQIISWVWKKMDNFFKEFNGNGPC